MADHRRRVALAAAVLLLAHAAAAAPPAAAPGANASAGANTSAAPVATPIRAPVTRLPSEISPTVSIFFLDDLIPFADDPETNVCIEMVKRASSFSARRLNFGAGPSKCMARMAFIARELVVSSLTVPLTRCAALHPHPHPHPHTHPVITWYFKDFDGDAVPDFYCFRQNTNAECIKFGPEILATYTEGLEACVKFAVSGSCRRWGPEPARPPALQP
jgi:hypothetical protein